MHTCCGLVAVDPLDPLTEDEIRSAAKACRDRASSEGLPELRFNIITLKVAA